LTRALTAAAALALLGTASKPVSIVLPGDAVTYKPGPGVAAVQARCEQCHSASYVYTQPALSRAQWTAEVNKMKAVYAADIPAEDIAPIVDYLVAQNGKT
jgi:hypothetical protein